MICDAGRSGGVDVWGLDAKAGKLVSQGSIPALSGCLVTCLHLDEDYLWVATADGNLQNFPLDNPDLPLALQTEPENTWNVNSPILSVCIDSDIGCGVVTTASGSIELMSLEDDETERPAGSFMPPFDATERRASNAYAMCCALVRHRAGNKALEELPCSIVCGGNDGSMYMQPLAFDDDGQVDFDRPFQKSMEQLSPRHMAAIKCLASPAPGMLISGGQDSVMRVWDIDKAKLLYQFSGYKVWLGSLWTDGVRVISDGADNTLIMHDFSHNEEQNTSENSD
jgi:WD40 repeat protein